MKSKKDKGTSVGTAGSANATVPKEKPLQGAQVPSGVAEAVEYRKRCAKAHLAAGHILTNDVWINQEGKKGARKGWKQTAFDRKFVPNKMYAVVVPDDILIVDADPKNFPPGQNSLKKLWKDLNLPPTRETYVVKSGTGGVHIWFRIPEHIREQGIKFRGNLTKAGYPGIDILTKGRFVFAAGSFNPGVKEWYRVVSQNPETLAEMPEAFLQFKRQPPAIDFEMESKEYDDRATRRQFIDFLEKYDVGPGNGRFRAALEGRDLGLSKELIHRLMSKYLLPKMETDCESIEGDTLADKINNAFTSGTNPQGCKNPKRDFEDVEVPESPHTKAYDAQGNPVTNGNGNGKHDVPKGSARAKVKSEQSSQVTVVAPKAKTKPPKLAAKSDFPVGTVIRKGVCVDALGFEDADDDWDVPEDLVWHKRPPKKNKDDDGADKRPAKDILVANLSNAVNFFLSPKCKALYKLIKYDEFSDKIFFRRHAPWHNRKKPLPDQWSDFDTLGLKTWWENNELFTLNKETCFDAVIRVGQHMRYNEFTDWLYNKLEPWNGISRLDTLLIDYAGAKDTPYTREVTKNMLLSAVKRGIDPGCQQDHMMILEGRQGSKKTSFWSVLGGRWHVEMDIDPTNKDSMAGLRGFLFIEMMEMSALDSANVQRLKGFISRRFDHYRPSYGRVHISVKRNSVFAGSANPDLNGGGSYRDTTGNRRLWPVAVRKRIDIEGIKAIRDQLFAEALHRIRKGEKWYIEDAELERDARIEQEKREIQDPWKELIAAALPHIQEKHAEAAAERGELPMPVTNLDIADRLEINPVQFRYAELKRISSCMRKLGWKRKTFTRNGRDLPGWEEELDLTVVDDHEDPYDVE